MALAVDFTNQASLVSSSTACSGRVAGDIANVIPAGSGKWRAGVLRSRFDATLTGGTNTSTDTYYMIHVPVGFWVLRMWAVTIVAETTNPTAYIALGDSDVTNGFMVAKSPSTTVGGIVTALYNGGETYGVIMGRYYAVANNLQILVSNSLAFTNLVIDVFAYCVDCRLPIASNALSAYGSAGGYGEPTPS